jgi:RNA polymerase sigma factor (sigma-70 family)
VAVKYYTPGNAMDIDDLVQEGNLGLMHAVRKFDWSRGTKFSTYAAYWIHQYISRAISNQGRLIRLPEYVDDQVRKLSRVRASLAIMLGREPTDAEAGDALELTAADVRRLDLHSETPISLSTDDGDIQVAAAEDGADDSSVAQDRVSLLLALLDDQEREVITLRYGLEGGEPLGARDVGRKLSIYGQVGRIERMALAKLAGAGESLPVAA